MCVLLLLVDLVLFVNSNIRNRRKTSLAGQFSAVCNGGGCRERLPCNLRV